MSEMPKKPSVYVVEGTLSDHEVYYADSMDAYIDALEARLAEAEAVIAKLPRTADGVPVVPGQIVFAIWPNGPIVGCYIKHESHGPDMVCFGEGSTTVNGLSCGIRVLAEDCYSTREAALAAKEARDAT